MIPLIRFWKNLSIFQKFSLNLTSLDADRVFSEQRIVKGVKLETVPRSQANDSSINRGRQQTNFRSQRERKNVLWKPKKTQETLRKRKENGQKTHRKCTENRHKFYYKCYNRLYKELYASFHSAVHFYSNPERICAVPSEWINSANDCKCSFVLFFLYCHFSYKIFQCRIL